MTGQGHLGASERLHRQSRRPKGRAAQASLQDIVGVLIFSALPFVTVQSLADSDLGKKLQVPSCLFAVIFERPQPLLALSVRCSLEQRLGVGLHPFC